MNDTHADRTAPWNHPARLPSILAQVWISLAILIFFYIRVLESRTVQHLLGAIRMRLGV